MCIVLEFIFGVVFVFNIDHNNLSVDDDILIIDSF